MNGTCVATPTEKRLLSSTPLMFPCPSALKLPATATKPPLSLPEYENANGPVKEACEYEIDAVAVAVVVPN
jgi:hypothetical protein